MNNQKLESLTRLFNERLDVAAEIKKEYFSNKEDNVRNVQLRYIKSLLPGIFISFFMLAYVAVLFWLNAGSKNDYWSEIDSLMIVMLIIGLLLIFAASNPLSDVKTFKGFYKDEIQNFREKPFDIIKFVTIMNIENPDYAFLMEEDTVNHEDIRKALNIIDVW